MNSKAVWKMSPYQQNIRNLCMMYGKKPIGKEGGYFYTETMTSYERWNQVQNQMLRQFPLLRLRAGRNGKFYEKKNTDYVLPREDFSEYTLEEALPVMEGWMRREEDWEDAPLFEWRYVRLKKGICMYGSFHHLILDGMSIKLFLQKQEQLYLEGEKEEKEDRSALLELEEKIWEQKDWKRARTWYRLHAPAETDGRQPLAHRADGRAGEVRGDLPETLFLKVLEKKSAWKVTTESLFFAAAASVLYALSPQETIRMGRVLGNRRYSQLGRLGMYVNLQPVMVSVREKEVFQTLCLRLKKELEEQLRLGDYPYLAWKEEAGEQDLICTVNYRNEKFLPRMKEAEVGEIFNGFLELPLRIFINEKKNGMELRIQYAVSGWGKQEGKAFFTWLLRALEQGLSDEGTGAGEMKLWEEDLLRERRRGPVWESPCGLTERCLDRLSRKEKEEVLKDAGRSLTGAEVLSFCSRLLKEEDWPEDGLIGLETEKNALLPAALLAVLFSGNGFFILDRSERGARREALRDCCSRVITQEELERCWKKERKEGVEPIEGSIPFLRRQAKQEDPESTAYVIGTSGTTGAPKLIQIPRRALSLRLAWMEHLLFSGADRDLPRRFLQKTRLTFDVSIWELFLPFFCGGSLFLLEEGREADFSAIARILRRERISVVHFVPAALEGFLRYTKEKGWEFPALHHMISSGEALAASLAEACESLLPGTALWNLYGPAECTIDVSYHRCQSGEDWIPLGRPVWECGLSVVNERGRELPEGIEGELLITGSLVGKGYLEGTAGKEQQARFGWRDGERTYRTGDRAVWKNDGNLYFLGRKDREIKLRGMRLDPAEIEKVMEQLPGLQTAALVLEKGILKAYYTGTYKESGALRRELEEYLPGYSIPDQFFHLEQFPLGRTGKKDLTALSKASEKESEGTDGWKKGERFLKKIISPYLAAELKTPEDSLFEAGLTSLGVAQAVLDLEEKGFPCEYQDFYRGGNLRALWANRKKKKRCFVFLGEPKGRRRGTVVCFPYAAGGPGCFQKMAEKLLESGLQVAVAQIHSFPECSVMDFTRQILEELPEEEPLWAVGYCAGFAPALAFAWQAEKEKRSLNSLWILGALPFHAGKKDEIFWDFLPWKAGGGFLEKVYGGHLPFSRKRYEQFRKEVRRSLCFSRDFSGSIETPAYLIFAEKDLLTIGSARNCKKYDPILKHIVKRWKIPGEGHYFVEKRGYQLARLLQKYGGEG